MDHIPPYGQRHDHDPSDDDLPKHSSESQRFTYDPWAAEPKPLERELVEYSRAAAHRSRLSQIFFRKRSFQPTMDDPWRTLGFLGWLSGMRTRMHQLGIIILLVLLIGLLYFLFLFQQAEKQDAVRSQPYPLITTYTTERSRTVSQVGVVTATSGSLDAIQPNSAADEELGWSVSPMPEEQSAATRSSPTSLSAQLSISGTAIFTSTQAPSATPHATSTPTSTPTSSLPTRTSTQTPSATPHATSTPTNSPTSLPTHTPTATPTSTPTASSFPTRTPTSLPTRTSTQTPSATPHATSIPGSSDNSSNSAVAGELDATSVTAANTWLPAATQTFSAPNSQSVAQEPTDPFPNSIAVGVIGVVTQVIDGDTVVVSTEEGEFTVGYLGIDAPELTDPLGAEAQALNESLTLGQSVYIYGDEAVGKKEDREVELMRYVFSENGRIINVALVEEGLATVDASVRGLFYEYDLQIAQRLARQAGSGLWAPTPTPSATKREARPTLAPAPANIETPTP